MNLHEQHLSVNSILVVPCESEAVCARLFYRQKALSNDRLCAACVTCRTMPFTVASSAHADGCSLLAQQGAYAENEDQ